MQDLGSERVSPPIASQPSETKIEQQTPLEKSPSLDNPFSRLRGTLLKRLEKISRAPNKEQLQKQSTEKSEPQKNAEALNSILKSNGDPKSLASERFTINFSRKTQEGNITTETFSLRFNEQGEIVLDDEQGTKIPPDIENALYTQENGQKMLNLQLITQKLVIKVFPDANPAQQNAIAEAILGRELQDPRELAHALGYLTRDDLAELLGVPTNPQEIQQLRAQEQKARSQGNTQLANEINKKIQLATTIYGEGTEQSSGISEIPDASEVIKVIKAEIGQNNDKLNLNNMIRKLQKEVNNLNENDPRRKSLNTLAETLKNQLTNLPEDIKNNPNLEQIITHYYTQIESGEEPDINLKPEQLGLFLNLFEQNRIIDEEHRQKIKERFEAGGKIAGIAAILMLILIYRLSQEGQG